MNMTSEEVGALRREVVELRARVAKLENAQEQRDNELIEEASFWAAAAQSAHP